jgi:hypothetical protein
LTSERISFMVEDDVEEDRMRVPTRQARQALRRAGVTAGLSSVVVMTFSGVAVADVTPRAGEPNCTGALLQNVAPGSQGALGAAVSEFAGPAWGGIIRTEARLAYDAEDCVPPG